MLEYLDLIRSHTSPLRMVKGHAFKMLGAPSCPWVSRSLQMHAHSRARLLTETVLSPLCPSGTNALLLVYSSVQGLAGLWLKQGSG